ncbi:hypothetical protein DFQ29_007653, partial [Apophysomyces sp. BC1021]
MASFFVNDNTQSYQTNYATLQIMTGDFTRRPSITLHSFLLERTDNHQAMVINTIEAYGRGKT